MRDQETTPEREDITDNIRKKKKKRARAFHIQTGRYQTSSSKRTKSSRLFLLRREEKRDFRSVLINQAVIMAPMPSCRLEGSRHPVTQCPRPRGQSPSQNSTPGRTPRANCPSQCQPFQCPPLPYPPLLPLSPSFLSFFSLSLPTLPSLLTTLRSSLLLRNCGIYYEHPHVPAWGRK